MLSIGSTGATKPRSSWRATSHWIIHRNRSLPTLAHALLCEDAGFHAYQIFEAGVRQFHEWADPEPKRHIMIAVVRYLAAHSPTERALVANRGYREAPIAR